MDGVTITIETGIIIWCVSFVIGLVFGVILRISLFIHTFLGAILWGWQLGHQGVKRYFAILIAGWVIGVISALGLLPGYLCGYVVANALYKELAWD